MLIPIQVPGRNKERFNGQNRKETGSKMAKIIDIEVLKWKHLQFLPNYMINLFTILEISTIYL